MLQSRDEIRQTYLRVWDKIQTGALLEPMEATIADVIKMHPEYHPMLSTGEAIKEKDFTPEGGQTNPFLHMGMHIAIREQAGTDRPAGIQAIYRNLLKKQDAHDAEHAMIECLGLILWQAQRDNRAPDELAFLNALKKL